MPILYKLVQIRYQHYVQTVEDNLTFIAHKTWHLLKQTLNDNNTPWVCNQLSFDSH